LVQKENIPNRSCSSSPPPPYLGEREAEAAVASADEEQPVTVGGRVQEARRLGARRSQDHRCHAVAGDLFASGFLYRLVKVLPLEECCKVGACSGW
jgi:hypothetical protein